MAATNRPDVLDPALLRPGRFDRQITINSPDVRGREAILKVHARNKHLDPSIKFDEVAQRIPGFSGADIENLLNEAALLAARDNRKIINIQDIDEAMDRVLMGPAKKSKKYTITLKSGKTALKKVKVTIKVKGKTYTAKTNSKGKAIFKIKNLKKKGTFKATITFKGNKNYNKVTKTVKIKCK